MQDGRVVTQAPGTATSQPGQVVLQPGPSGVVGGSQLYSVPTSVQQPQYVQVVQPGLSVDYSAGNQSEVDQLRSQLASANQRIMNLEMANMKLSDEKVAIEHAQTIIKNLDQTAGEYRVKCMELEASCEQYRRALETNTINQDQVSKMSAKFTELHVKVANLEAAVDRYRLQEEEWQTKLNQSDGQARVILVMSEQLDEWRAKCAALEESCMRFQGEVQQAQGMQGMLDRLQKEYGAVAENCRQLERANAAMELQLERAKASGAIGRPAAGPTGAPY